jgi:hypothetical protein
MENKNIWIIVVDDWELRGDGSGSVIELQYENALKIMNLFENLGINMTFNVEVMQQLAFEKYSNDFEDLKKYKEYWLKTIRIMLERGFDIQLHIHPQWFNAIYDGENWKLDTRWNIADYPKKLIEFFIKSSLNYLEKNFNGLKPISFRGGAWGAYPSSVLFKLLEKYGIKIDISMVNGLFSRSKNINLDYRNLESPYLPYYPDYDDVRKVSKKANKIIEIPTQSFIRDWKFKIKKASMLFFSIGSEKKMNKKVSYSGIDSKADYIVKNKAKKDYIIMDITNLDIFALKIGFDFLIKRAMNNITNSRKIVPLVLESHTKDLNDNQVQNIRKAIKYIMDKYRDVLRFATISEIYKNKDLTEPIIKQNKL